MVNAVMRSSDFKSSVEPILSTTFDGRMDLRKDEWKAFASSQKAPHERSYFEEDVLYGFGSAPELPDGQPITYDAGGEMFKKRYDYKVYGLAFAITQVLMEDGEHISIGSTYSKYLADALIETKETNMVNILNRAFNPAYRGGDSKELVATDHPLAVGGTWSNKLATASVLSQTSLEQMLINIRDAVDYRGKKVHLQAKNLIIPTSQIMNAEVILNSALKTGSNFNDLNPLKSKGLVPGGAHDISRLTSKDAWFVTTNANDERGIKIITRRKVQRGSEGDFETGNMKYKATERYGFGWTDSHAIYGTPGI